MKKWLTGIIAAILLTGCAQQTFTVNSGVALTPRQTQTQHFFFNGIAQQKSLDAAAVCGSTEKVAKVEVEQTALNGLVSAVTFGIYSPREARVYCLN